GDVGTGDPTSWKHFTGSNGTGTLVLNMGNRSQIRGIADCADSNTSCNGDELVIVDHVDGDATGETVKVTTGGREQVFPGVRRIVANSSKGNDQLYIHPGVLVPVDFTGGDGNDVFIDQGSGFATVDMGAGNDYVQLG